MPVTLSLTFPAGRFHGTPWGHHVNEGLVEWPPSPWRVLRALLASAYRQAEPVDETLLASLLGKLSAPPGYLLPPYTTGHTRHYMPKDSLDRDKRDRVLDAFVAISTEARLRIAWEHVDLHDPELQLLRQLCASLTYLGRAESWCDVAVSSDLPSGLVRPGEGEGEPQSLLALASGAAALDVLSVDTAELHKRGGDVPAGTSWVRYFIAPPEAPRAVRPSVEQSTTAALYALDGPVWPQITESVDVADAFHAALLARLDSRSSAVLTGRSHDGRPRRDNHRHAHVVPLDLRGDGRVRHLLVWAVDPFNPAALDALGSISYFRRKRKKLHIALVEASSRERLPLAPYVQSSTVWTSRTPFLLTRHPKTRRGVVLDSAEDQLRRELERRGLPEPIQIERLERLEMPRTRPLRWLEFRRWRGRKQPAVPEPYGFRLQFASPIAGPLCLGFGSHYGLGSFVAVS